MKRRVLVLVVPGAAASPVARASRNRGRRCNSSWPDCEPAAREAAIEKFIAAKGGTPIVENQTRLTFLAKDKNGQTPRIVGDFNAWAVTPQGYDVVDRQDDADRRNVMVVSRRRPSYTNARLEYGLLFDKEYIADPMNPRTVQAFAGPRSEVRMPFFDRQPEVDELAIGARRVS